MKFFADTAEVADIKELAALGLLDGVTTNPSLVAKSGRKFVDVVAEIAGIVEGPVSAEVTALDYATMIKEAAVLKKIAKNIAIKVPLTLDGLKACRALRAEGVMVSFISPFIGRLDDIHQDGTELIAEIRQIYDNYGFETEILAASIRTPLHVKEVALLGADIATCPPAVIKALASHPLTDKGLAQFSADWKKTGQSIL
jgi:transaldolase